MKRYLIQQMRNEWRSNLWMIIEIAIVAVVLWAIFSFFAQIVAIKTQDYGYDTTDVLMGYIKTAPSENQTENDYETTIRNRDNLILNLRQNPYVELVGIGSNPMPYNFNFEGVQASFREDTIYHYVGGLKRVISPEIVKIIRLKSLDGKTTEQLAEVVEKGEIILGNIDPNMRDDYSDFELFLNRRVALDGDTSKVYYIGALAKSMHRSDYESLFFHTLYYPQAKNEWASEVVIRVKEGKAKEFLASLKQSDIKVGNVYVSDIMELSSMADRANLNMDNMVRNAAVCAGFMLLVVFLGFLGTFWFRTQQRVPEIAVRKVNGATRGDVFRRLISESMIMLAISLVVAAVVADPVMKSDVLNFLIEDNTTTQFVYGAIATVVVLMIMIVAGVWFPARTAMNVNPADALKDQ